MWDRRRVIAAFVVAVVGSSTGVAPAAAGAPLFRFHVRIGDSCVNGVGPRDTAHVVSLYTSDGQLKDRNRLTSTGRRYTACFFQLILGNDRLVAEAAGQKGAFRVPALTPVIDRVSDEVTGRARPGTTVDLTLHHSNRFASSQPYSRQTVVDAGGRYSVDYSDVDIVGADQVEATWTNGYDTVYAKTWASFITYGRVSSNVVGSARRGDDVRIELIGRDGDVRGVAHGGMPVVFQHFDAVFIDGNGDDVFPMRGDRVVAPFTGDADLLVPRMILRADIDRDRVAGACMPESPFQLWVFYGQVEPIVRKGMTDENGDFDRGLGIDLQLGHYMSLNCRYPTGDFVYLDQEV